METKPSFLRIYMKQLTEFDGTTMSEYLIPALRACIPHWNHFISAETWIPKLDLLHKFWFDKGKY